MVYSSNDIYLCPTDIRHVCSWEGTSDEIWGHFLEEHDDLYSEGNEIIINLAEKSENKLLFYEEEIYLAQTKVHNNELGIYLRYLGPTTTAQRISYTVHLTNESNNKELGPVTVKNGASIYSFTEDISFIKCNFNICLKDICEPIYENIPVKETNDRIYETISVKGYNDHIYENIPVKETNDHIYENIPVKETNDHINENVSVKEDYDPITEDTDDLTPVQLNLENVIQNNNDEVPSTSETSTYISKKLDPEEKLEESDSFTLELRNIGPLRTDFYLKRTQSLDVESRKIGVKRNSSLLNYKPDYTPLCTNCKERILPPVFLCEMRHDICNTCKQNRHQCTICDNPITSERNVDYENRLRTFKYTCKYSGSGCAVKPDYSEILAHEVMCTYCYYTCPIDDCIFTAQHQKIKEHFKIRHGSIKLHEAHIAKFPKGSKMFLAHQNGVFYCYSEEDIKNGTVKWIVQFLGPKERYYHIKLSYSNKFNLSVNRKEDLYILEMSAEEVKKHKMKSKVPTLNIGFGYAK